MNRQMTRWFGAFCMGGALLFAAPQAEAKCNKKCQAAQKKNKQSAESYCNSYRKQYNRPCKVAKGLSCGNGWRKLKVFGSGKTMYRSCRQKLKNETANKIRNAFNSVTVLVNLYKIYFKIASNGAGMNSIPSKLQKKYQKYYSVPMGSVKIGESTKLNASGMTDCYKIYFKPSRGMLAQIRKGIFKNARDERLFLHELTHAQQCHQQGGRNNYAKLWFKHLSIGTLKLIGQKKKVNDDNLHKTMPMEAQAQAHAVSVQAKVKNNEKGE